MELDDSSEVKRCSEEDTQLTQNSSITVTIDDLTEGLIVVSFAHSDNLYQGVLFQLNRERGIPSGISFAKEHVLGSTSSLEKSESDPTQTIPLHQRHSYNQQGICNGASHSPISQPSLRRIIKPPARFKNARMSLRLRARPVLCAKCRTLCDDKADSSGKDESSKEENPTTEKNKKERPKVSKRDPGNVTTAIGLNGKFRGNDVSQGGQAVEPQDLCYESVGSSRVIENYWRRPLVQPLIPSTEETYARLRKHKGSTDSSRDKKKIKTTSGNAIANPITTVASGNDVSPTPLTVHQDSPKTSGNENVETVPQKLSTNNTTFVTKSNVCDNNFPNTRSRKALNLKMCITKIAEMRNGGNEIRKKELDKSSSFNKKKEDISIFLNPPTSPLHHHSDSSLESTTEMTDNCLALSQEKTSSADECSGFKTRASSKKSKAWENRIRTKSTVPVRYRDESYLTKNIFNFNKRRPPSSSSGDIPVLTISRSDDENTFKVSALTDAAEGNDDDTVTTSKLDDNFEAEKEETLVSTVQSSSCSPHEHDHSADENHHDDDDNESRNSPSSSSNVNEVPAPISIKSTNIPNRPAELIKTPTIKITFGSSGNGMVVQIPPKITQHVESTSTTEMKAARKAMKKAKKEAKRRRSISPDFSPSSNAFSPDHLSKTERSNPPSPVTPVAVNEPHQELDNVSQQPQDVKSLIDFNTTEPSTSTRVPKKKKKQKKRRRNSKVLKENDGFTSSSSHEPIVYNMSSPHSTSSCNQDNSTGGYESPSATSVKSYNLDDSISNPSAQESVSSFCKGAYPPRRRRSMPATSTTSNSAEAPRVCINLKRIDTNAYVPLPLHSVSVSPHSQSDNDGPSSLENSTAVDEDETELNDFPSNNGSSHANETDILDSTGESVEYYKDKETECAYRKGDIVWGKLPKSPWWPGKIDDILTGNGEETRAKVSWYKSTTQSCMRFQMLVPFTEYFDSKYARSRRRGSYQHAVKDALVEAHKLNPEDLPTD